MTRKKPTITYEGQEYRQFIPYPTKITDGTLRCIFCGQIDEEGPHDTKLCPAGDDFDAELRLSAERGVTP